MIPNTNKDITTIMQTNNVILHNSSHQQISEPGNKQSGYIDNIKR